MSADEAVDEIGEKGVGAELVVEEHDHVPDQMLVQSSGRRGLAPVARIGLHPANGLQEDLIHPVLVQEFRVGTGIQGGKEALQVEAGVEIALEFPFGEDMLLVLEILLQFVSGPVGELPEIAHGHGPDPGKINGSGPEELEPAPVELVDLLVEAFLLVVPRGLRGLLL
jgi:hypothetical protein